MIYRNIEAVKKAADSLRKQPHIASDEGLAVLQEAAVGRPAMMYTPENEPCSWIVPFLKQNRACGFATVDLSGAVCRAGVFGRDSENGNGWIDADFFQRPPAKIIEEINDRYPEARMKTPFFSYDETPDDWAWRIEMFHIVQSVVFIVPGGWYERLFHGRKGKARR